MKIIRNRLRPYNAEMAFVVGAGVQVRAWLYNGARYRHGGDMADIERISAQQAHTKIKANQALLVCAYEDEAKCQKLNLEGSISFASLQSRTASLPKTQEIIFY